MAIDRFRDEYYFLSSMYPVKGGIEVGEDIVVPTVENAYQAGKFDNMQVRKIVLLSKNGIEAKETAQKYYELGVPIRKDWEEIKIPLMTELVNRKFAAGTAMSRLLLQTEDEELIEGNTWGDNFWGVSPPGNPQGLNWLGKILMQTRARLREENSRDYYRFVESQKED